MIKTNQPKPGCKTLLSIALTLSCIGSQAFADDDRITLIEMGDLHGTLVPHAAILKNPDGTEREVASAGGLARLKTVVNEIRADNPEAVLLSTGDLTHGSAEAMFTVGDAMMIPMNAFGIDVYTPGNWDFGYGGAVFRNRFTSFGPKPTIPGNIRTMSGYIGCDDVPVIEGLTDTASGYTCNEITATAPYVTPDGMGVIKANFPTVAANLYNAAPLPAPLHGKPVLPAFKMLERNGTSIAVIGLTASIVPQQADTFNIGLRFTQGVEELPGLIEQVKDLGAELIVVQSELGLSQNIKIAQSFRDIDVMYSAHTHEVTLGALLVSRNKITRTTPGESLNWRERLQLAAGAAIVVETNRDMYVGRLDLEMKYGRVADFDWEAIPVDESVAEDPAMAQLVAAMEEDFVAGTDGEIRRHTFMPGGFVNPSIKGLQLVDDLDTVVGYTDTLLLRHHVLEDTLNNFLADAIRSVTDGVADVRNVPGWENGVDISMANGFRFGNAVLPGSAITLRDLYTWFPIAPAVNIADFSGQSIQNSLNTILGAVFDRNVFMQRGGWYLGLANMEQKIDLKNRPFSSSGSRVVETKIGGQPLDLGKRYVFASCYGHGNPLDDVCRTGGGANHKFFQLADADDYNSEITLAEPVNKEGVITGATVKQVAPNNFLHPVHALRRYLDSLTDNTVTDAQFGTGQGRVVTVDSKNPGNLPQSESEQIGQPDNTPDPTFVQPPFGAGPDFFSGHIGHSH
ncbi:MAG: 5'-nucleotidase C-terminal domain-containing protein [Gammaproteobacteria bacterium]|nr:5'-nucleotidase C-terminal domain-containing protein [Gammaproteobacteria bacterium]